MHHDVRKRTSRRHRHHLLTAAGTALALALGLLTGPLATGASAATPDTTRNSTWTSFANNTNTSIGQWSGGDGTIGVGLPDGRVSFAFSDTFRGPVTSDGIHPPFQTAGVFNSMVMASGTAANASLSTVTVPGETNNWGAKPLVENPAGFGYKLWAGDGAVYGGQLVRLYTGLTAAAGSGCFIFGEPLTTYVAKFDLPSGGQPTLNTSASFTVSSSSAPAHISWGTAILNDGAYTYIYGAEDVFNAGCGVTGRRLHIARVPLGQFGQPWTQIADIAMPAGLFSEFSVAKLGSLYYLITQNYGQNIVAYASTTPGSFSGTPTNLYSIPVYKSVDLLRYAGRMQPALTTSSEIVLSYNTNSIRVAQDSCIDETVLDASVYRPRFVRVPRTALPTSASSLRAQTTSTAPPGGAAQRPALSYDPETTATGTAPAAAPTAAKAAAKAAIPIPTGSIVWAFRPNCGTGATPTNFTAVPGIQAPSPTTQVSWDYKGPTVDTAAARWTPNDGWGALPLLMLGASPLPAVPANAGPPISLLAGSPQRIRWTDTPFAAPGQTVRYQLCIKPAGRLIEPDPADPDQHWVVGEQSPDCKDAYVTIPT
ncbi:hypothetical protein [Actinocorallia longicatena]|uniref:DUF4185 domain-containing protein n=1 Tax=Actinocorallia longicatena TaxID=111803 RepID=A0ABP6Q5A1_9ACTN